MVKVSLKVLVSACGDVKVVRLLNGKSVRTLFMTYGQEIHL